MTILSALARAYERLPDAPVSGFATQNVGILVSLEEDGTPAGAHDLRGTDKKRTARAMAVPAPVKRTAGIRPNSFWDKTAYALGVTAGASRRTVEENAAFIAHHRTLFGETDDPGLRAFLRFLDDWRPERWAELGLPDDARDQNVVFALEADRLANRYLHDRPAARAILASGAGDADGLHVCLVTGRAGRTARLHPSVKGVWGGQTAGGAIVSFNLDAFESYGHSQGDNAPVSEGAAEAYTGALNHFLRRDSANRVQIGDASTVFWAEADDEEAARLAERVVSGFFSGTPRVADVARSMESDAAKSVGIVLEKLRAGRKIEDAAPKLARGVRFHVLGLAPNAARISIRFWMEDDFAHLAENWQRFWNDMAVEPLPPGPPPVLWQYLAELAPLQKLDNVPKNLSGEWTRSILSGTAYPLTLFSTILMRIRADGEVNGRRVSILKALLRRNFHMTEEEAPVALDATNRNRGYLLGRLFAAYEQAQSAALGRSVNATIKDKFYGAASAQPRRVFPMLETGSANHLSKLGKVRPGQRVNLEKTIAEIMDLMEPGKDPFPASLPAPEQALFGLGYYHQRSRFFTKSAAPTANETADD